jgi:uncharacterized membrane protein YfcA
VSPEWVAAAVVIAVASFVLGLAGFGIGLVAMALLPFLMSPVTAIVILTMYTCVLVLVILVPVWRHLEPARVLDMLAGTLVGTPLGVWALSTFPASTLRRLIGLTLVAVVLLEWSELRPKQLVGRAWGVGAGVLAGVAGGAVGTPGPPVILYSTTQGWSPRTFKANLQAFFFVNQVVILAGYWWAGLVDAEAWRLAASFALPAAGGTVLGMLCFNHVDQHRFRRLVFTLLLVSGLALLARG